MSALTICGPITAAKAGASGPSVADLAAFDALPDDVRDLAKRVLGAPIAGAALVEKAYRLGWDDCNDEWEHKSVWLSDRDVADAVKRLVERAP